MRYIDKYIKHPQALALNVGYLKSVYRRNLSHPDPSPAEAERSFKSFKRYKNGWKPLLLEEQMFEGASRCCYCMRRLNDTKGTTNIEHVISKSLSGPKGQTQYAYYASCAPALRDHVMMADEFVGKHFSAVDDLDLETHMPHTTALSNLVVACNGTRDTFKSVGCCCNAAHDSNIIMPIMLMKEAETDVKYDANGIITISCNDGNLDAIINELNSDTLMKIRSVWYHLSRVKMDLAQVETMSKRERADWFKKAYGTDDFSTLPDEVKRYSSVLDRSNEDTYWRLLLAYDWFYYYSGYANQRATIQ